MTSATGLCRGNSGTNVHNGAGHGEIICEIADNLRLYSQNPQSHALDDILHTVACKSAIRGNDKNSMEELQALAEQVYTDERIRHCPHGRPVMFTMTRSNIEHQFGRT